LDKHEKFFVGAYTSAPSIHAWDPPREEEFFRQLRSQEVVRGLEHPYVDKLSAHDDGWFLHQLHPDWELVLTTIPGVMQRMKELPRFGLASTDETGRGEALRFMEGVRNAVEAVQSAFGRPAVVAVQLHSAPNLTSPGTGSSADALAASLAELLSWDWCGAALAVEHCDSFREGVAPQKALLTLDEELSAIRRLCVDESRLGVTLNWGRSAVEGHSSDRPVEHARRVRASGLPLLGLMFSGACAVNNAYGSWKDTHAPLAPAAGAQYVEPGSLLTEEAIQQWVDAAEVDGPAAVRYLGVKLLEVDPAATIERRIGINLDAITVIRRCLARAAQTAAAEARS
jgi:hypothetical protein